ncbi:hypothetical protein YC2023_042511 [Brassica napus]
MEKRLAISTVIASAAASGGAIVVKEFIGRFEKPRKKKFLDAMKRWGLVPKGKTIFLMVDVEENVAKSSRNIGMLRNLPYINQVHKLDYYCHSTNTKHEAYPSFSNP